MARVTRRGLLVGGAAATGLVIAWSIWPRAYGVAPQWQGDDAIFGAYLSIARNGSVIIAIPQCEMGQGIGTVIAQIIAEELGADWRSIALAPAPPEPVFANKVLASRWAAMLTPAGWPIAPDENDILVSRFAAMRDFCVTADDSELAAYEAPCREAGAIARVMLCKAAAARWGVDWESCEARDGFVAQGNEQIRFADLLDEALAYDVPDPVPLRASLPGNIRTGPIGDAPPFARLDLPAKVDGTAKFAGDIRLPDMVYAAIRQGPIGDSKLKSVNTDAARKVTGFIDVVEDTRWVAAVASNWWAARQAIGTMQPLFHVTGPLAESDAIDEVLDSAFAKGRGGRLFESGAVDTAWDGKKALVADYTIAAAPHATIETSSATARYRDGSLELWVASQAPGQVKRRVANALGISERAVTLYPMMAGGSFDRRLDSEVATQVAKIARKIGRPVQLVWSRGEESIHDPVRTPAAARAKAVVDRAGRIEALSISIACPPTAREFGQRLFLDKSQQEARLAVADEFDPLAVAGAIPPYAIPVWQVNHYPVGVPIVTGRWRGNAASYGCFVVESFIDEMAGNAGREPLSYRIQMLGDDVRLARCLTRVGSLAQWDGGLDNSGLGVACCNLHGGAIAVIASARRASDAEGGIRVDRLFASVDAGRIVNQDIALQQIEGGMIFGLAMALGSATGFSRGLAASRRLRDLDLPQLADTPDIVIDFVDSDEDPAGLGELGVPAVAPAIANALYSATGLRFRQLPLLSAGL